MAIKVNCAYKRLVPIEDIKPNPENPNTHSDKQIELLVKNIKALGWRLPITVSNQSGYIVRGHARRMAGEILKCKKIPVDFQDYENEELEYTDMIADNRIAELSEFDNPGLADIIQRIDTGRVDLECTGFTENEIEDMMTRYFKPQDGLTDDDAVPEVKRAIAKKGDVWLLGDHRLCCGDARIKDDVRRLTAGERAVLMVTDPPYGVDYDPKWRKEAGINKSDERMGEIKNDDVIDWSDAYKLFKGDICYIWHDGKHAGPVQISIEKCGFEIVAQIIWVKDKYALSRGNYHWKHEPCFYAVRKGKNHNWNGKRDQCTAWDINRVDKNEEGLGLGAQKPMQCMQKPIENNSKVGDIVYDCFGGTGTTLIACEKLDRKCHMMEIDRHYCDVIIRRWEDYTGKKAVKLIKKKVSK